MSRENRSGEHALQPALWEEPSLQENNTVETRDPERKLVKLHRDADNRYLNGKNSLIDGEVRAKMEALRNRIGLPVARGKDPHVNDYFYKFLVSRIYTDDRFGIFREYGHAIDGVPEELDLKINQISGLIDELLNKGLNRPQRSNRFYQFDGEYREKNVKI